MDHVKEAVLCIADVARFWARESNAVYTEGEIVDILVQAMWRGDLVIDPPTGHKPRDRDYRYSLLRAVAGVRDHPGLLFVRPDEPVGPVEEVLPNGDTLLDIRTRIAWVVDGAEPDETTATRAFAALAAVDLDAYDPATIVPILRALPVERDALRSFCEVTGQPLPSFWFPKTTTRSTASAKSLCVKWLADLVRAGPKPDSKPRLKLKAMAQFPGLSGAGFDEAWKKTVPPSWREPGAPTKAKRRKNR